MKIFILSLLLFTTPLFPQYKKAGKNNLKANKNKQEILEADQKKQGTLEIEALGTFFNRINSLKSPPTRGEFETREEYQKRLPEPFDTTKIYYLKISGMHDKGHNYSSHYKYDIDKEELTFFGKDDMKYYMDIILQKLQPDNIKKWSCNILRISDNNEYTASNGFGAVTKVTRYYETMYNLFFTNIESAEDLPDSVLHEYEKSSFLKLTLKSPPKEAEKLSGDISLLVGFTTSGPSDSGSELKYLEATYSNPVDYFYHFDWINAKFKSLLLYNEKTGEVLARYDYPGKKKDLLNK